MSDTVIRRDIIQLELESDALKEIEKLQKEIDDLKKKLLGGIGEDEFDKTKKSVEKTRKEIDKTTASTKKLVDGLVNVGKKASGIAYNGLKKIAKLSFNTLITGLGAASAAIVKFANMASDLYETEDKVLVSFGVKDEKGNVIDDTYSKQVLEWVKGSTGTMGLAKQTALDMAALFGDMGTSMGLTAKSAADMSTSLVERAADIASFKNMDIASVTTALNGVFTGETESLKRLGVVMTEANLEQYALTKGITKSYKEMTQAEKVMLRYDYVLDQTKNSMGDYKRTGGGFANQLRTMTENFKELGTILGKLPMEKLASGMKVINDALVEVQEILSDGLQDGDMDKIMNIVDGLIDKGVKALADGVPVLLPKVMMVLETVAEGVVKAVPKVAPILATSVVDLMIGLGKIILNNKDELVQAAKDVVMAVVQALYEGFTGKELNGNMKSGIESTISKLLPVIGGIAGSLVALGPAMKVLSGIQKIKGVFGGKSNGGSGEGGSGGLFGGLFKGFANFAKAKPTAILKGMANLAIVLGGFLVFAAVFAAVAPAIARMANYKELLELAGIITVLGIIGAVLTNFAATAGAIPVSTVAKGLANMAIMLGGMTVIGAAFAWVAPYIAALSDSKSLLEVAGIITLLGVIGTALSVFAGIAGIIPVSTVALGLANMAIMLGGMTTIGAAFAWVAPYIAQLSDSKSLIKVATIITVLGTIGTVLTIFAGIAGLVPFPVVLAGLANIALVLGGMTAIVTAFGALSKIDGFNELITSGGDLLANLFGQLGKIVGSLAGGFLEGITSTLPQVGESLGQFGENIKPLFEIFNGVDTSGLGAFFTGLAGFIGAIAVDKIVSFFTGGGGTGFAAVAEGLGALASDGTKNFFAMVKEIEEPAYTNAGKFFTALDGISKLPNVGGIGQMFSGENDYSGVAAGLKMLTSEGVKNFFSMVAGMEESSFTNAEKFFTALDGISALPNVGGIGQIFTGENDFEGVASGLKALSGEGVKNFFAMVKGLAPETLEKTTSLFKTLAGINEVGEKGFWESLGDALGGGDDKSPLSTIASGLSDFASKAETFFTLVNGLELGNLNGLWDSLERAEGLTTDIAVNIGKDLDDIVKKVSKLPERMGEGLRAAGESLSTAIVEVWKDAVKASVAPVNKLLSGANHILKEFGSDKKVISWEPYARGTDGHKGGNALVNDGRGAELVQMPNGYSFIPQGRNVLIPNAPKGMKVLPAGNTAQLMGRSTPTFRYADGIGEIDIWSFIDNPSGLVSKISEGISYDGMSEFAASAGKGMVSTFSSAMSGWVEKLFEEEGILGLADYVAGAGVAQWRSTVIRALKMEGQYSASNVAKTLFQMQTESGGNPKAINLWDSNAKKGIPSKGLMQVIDPTFRAYARDGFDKNVYDPLSNILASIRYAVSRYGSLGRAYRGVGYANGGIATKPSIFGEDGAEMAIPLSVSKRSRALDLWSQTGEMLGMSYSPEKDSEYYTSNHVEQNTYSPQFNLTITGTNDERTLARKVKAWVAEAMDDMFSALEEKSPRLQEV